MNATDETPARASNMELLKQQAAACGAGCACHAGGASGRAKLLICGLVLLVAAVLVVRAVTKTGDTEAKVPDTGFAVPAGEAAAPPAGIAEKPADPGGTGTSAPTVKRVGTVIGMLAELNTVATGSDAVFVYLPGSEANAANGPATALEAAARTIGGQGAKCALFTLKPGSPDYANLGPQTPVQCVLAMVRGKGMSAVAGEITETKLVQGYVAASSAGGCGPGAEAGGVDPHRRRSAVGRRGALSVGDFLIDPP